MTPPTGPISSAANPAIKRVRALEQKKFRDELGLFVVEGSRHVAEALAAGWVGDTLLATAKGKADKALRGFTGLKLEVTPDLLSRLTGKDNAPEVVATFRQKFASADAARQGLWVGLEEIRDPGNLGTIIRTAEAAGASGVVLIGNCCDPFMPEAIRASVGAFARVPLVRLSAAAYGKWRREYSGEVIGTAMAGAVDYREIKYKPDALLLMGSEHAGLSKAALESCTLRAYIPMRGKIESLNVATATALMLYEANRRVLKA